MAQLKPGHVSDFANSMAEAIENALQSEWQTVKGSALPSAGADDRKILFVAIAQGVLGYLKANQAELISTITLQTASVTVESTVTDLELNIGTG